MPYSVSRVNAIFAGWSECVSQLEGKAARWALSISNVSCDWTLRNSQVHARRFRDTSNTWLLQARGQQLCHHLLCWTQISERRSSARRLRKEDRSTILFGGLIFIPSISILQRYEVPCGLKTESALWSRSPSVPRSKHTDFNSCATLLDSRSLTLQSHACSLLGRF